MSHNRVLGVEVGLVSPNPRELAGQANTFHAALLRAGGSEMQ